MKTITWTGCYAVRCICFICCLIQPYLAIYSSSEVTLVAAKHELNDATIYDVCCSSTGYVWLATHTGISRYDGFRFRNFPLNTSSGSPSYAVCSITEKENLLFLRLLQGGIACFDERREVYIPISLEAPFASGEITAFKLGDKNTICMGTGRGLYAGTFDRIREEGKEVIRIRMSGKPVIPKLISGICGDEAEVFACVDKSEIWCYLPATGKLESLQRYGDSGEITTLYLEDRYLWICSSSGTIRCYDRKLKRLARTIEDKRGSGRMALSDTEIKTMVAVNDSTYYIATWNGLFRLAFNTKDIVKADYELCVVQQADSQGRSGLFGKLLKVCWNKSQDALWVATYGNGIIKIDFQQYMYNRLSQHFDTDIYGVAEDMQGYVWLTAKQRGVWRSTTKSFSANTTFEPWTKGVNPDGTYNLYKDRNGFLWLGGEASKVICINPLSGEVATFTLLPRGTEHFAAAVRQFCVDTRNRLWIVTTGGLLLLEPKTGNCELIAFNDGNVPIKDIYCITEDENGSIWLGTDCGVRRMEFQNGEAKLYGGYEKKAGLESLSAYSVYVNSYNQIFVSYPDKVLRIDGRNKREENEDISTAVMNGLNSGCASAIVDDLNGNTWLGDNSGIVTIRNDKDLFYRYPLNGGCDRVCRLRNGQLLWAGNGDLLFFDPIVVKSNKNKSVPVLSGLDVDGKPVAVGEIVNGRVILESTPGLQHEYIFYSRPADITFYFSDMQYDGELRKIAYRLLPEEEWSVVLLKKGVSYKYLSAGNYTLQVKLVFPDASESRVVEIPILVKDSWWKTGWAYGGYFLLFLGVVTGIFRYLVYRAKKREANRVRELELKEMLSIEKNKRDRYQEIENMQDRLLALFVREMRTPLSLIIAPLKELAGEQLPSRLLSKVDVAYRNSVDLLDACNQLLAIYTEKPLGKKLEVSLCSIDKLVDGVVFSVKELVRINHIDFRYNKKTTKGAEIYVDSKRICFVLHNLLSNAFNHINFPGMVSLTVSETFDNDIRYCTISVSDSGKHKVMEASQYLLNADEKFFEDISAIEIGFEIMERIVQSHHGFMTLKSIEEEGTEVTLNIPMEKGLLENDPDIVFVTPDGEEQSERVVDTLPVQKEMVQEEIMQVQETVAVQERIVSEEVQLTVSEPSPLTKKKTLLVVEDHKDIRLYLKVLFSKEYDILLAINGQEGIDMAQREQPDLILCDVMMPVKDGLQCCREIKEGLDTCHIPFIMLTAKVEDDDIIHGLEIGADDYILKPFTPGILKAKVRNLINGRITLKQMYTRLLVLPDAENGQKEGKGEEEPGDPFINMVIKVVEDNIREADFSVKKLAAEMNMSQPTLYRKIKQTTDFTVIELIRGVRMRKAAIILKQKRHAVQEVAEMVGYNDIPTFRKHFVDTFGATPSTYANTVGSDD